MRTAHGSGLDNSCESRNAKLVEEECIDVQLLSELKFQANDLAVPLDELALLAIETCAQNSSVENGAELSSRNITSMTTLRSSSLAMARWFLQTTKCSRWCVGPNGLQPQTSRGIASRYAKPSPSSPKTTRGPKLRARNWKPTRSCAPQRSIARSCLT